MLATHRSEPYHSGQAPGQVLSRLLPTVAQNSQTTRRRSPQTLSFHWPLVKISTQFSAPPLLLGSPGAQLEYTRGSPVGYVNLPSVSMSVMLRKAALLWAVISCWMAAFSAAERGEASCPPACLHTSRASSKGFSEPAALKILSPTLWPSGKTVAERRGKVG